MNLGSDKSSLYNFLMMHALFSRRTIPYSNLKIESERPKRSPEQVERHNCESIRKYEAEKIMNQAKIEKAKKKHELKKKKRRR